MRLRLQFGGMILAGLLAALPGVSLAMPQQEKPQPPPRQERAPQRQQPVAPRRERPPQRQQQPMPQRREAPTQRNSPGGGAHNDRGANPRYSAPPMQQGPGGRNENRPPTARSNGAVDRNYSNPRGNENAGQETNGNRQYANPNRPPQGYTPNNRYEGPGTNRPRQLTPAEMQRLQQNQQRFNQLSPQQQQEMREREQVWQRMTHEQRQHVRNDVLPKWQQMPQERRQMIQQRLRILRDMPESARDRRLSDPNFTRGMSEEDRATLHDLSHLHVGGALEPPNESNPQ